MSKLSETLVRRPLDLQKCGVRSSSEGLSPPAFREKSGTLGAPPGGADVTAFEGLSSHRKAALSCGSPRRCGLKFETAGTKILHRVSQSGSSDSLSGHWQHPEFRVPARAEIERRLSRGHGAAAPRAQAGGRGSGAASDPAPAASEALRPGTSF